MVMLPTLQADPRIAAPPSALAAASDWVLLSNPQSFRMSLGDRVQRLEALAVARDIPVFRVSDLASIAAAVAAVAERGASCLAVASGDGTLHAIVSELMRRAPVARWPAVLLLGGGRGNFIARDLGSAGDVATVFSRVLERGGQPLRRTRRAVLHMRQAGGFSEHGFFAAGAMVGEIIRDCHDYRAAGSGWLRTGRPATQWRLLQLSVLAALGRRRFATPELAIEADPLGRMSGPVRLLACSSLQHADGLLNPFAARGEGPVRLTAVRAGAAGAWRRVPGLMTGRSSPSMQPVQGYLSGRCDRISIMGLDSLVIDGQAHRIDASLPLEFSATESLEFLLP